MTTREVVFFEFRVEGLEFRDECVQLSFQIQLLLLQSIYSSARQDAEGVFALQSSDWRKRLPSRGSEADIFLKTLNVSISRKFF
jgi:hypothetical protein